MTTQQMSEQMIREQGWTPVTHNMGPFMDLLSPIWSKGGGADKEYGVLITEKHLNINGIAHGGLLMSLVDQIISLVINDHYGPTNMSTIDMSTHFISPAAHNDWVIASVQIKQRTRRMVFATTQLTVGERVVLSGQAIMRLKTS